MRKLRLFAVVVAACGAALAASVPQVLIVQIYVPKVNDVDVNVPITQALAQELEEQGRVMPVAWGLSDPYFRAAVDDRILKNPPELPNLQQAQQAATQLKADYLFVVTAWQEGIKFKARAQLYRRGSLVWEDPKKNAQSDAASKNAKVAEDLAKKNKMQPPTEDDDKPDPTVRTMMIQSVAEFSAENASRSLARTYAQLLNAEPFRSHEARPRQNTPEPDDGQRTITIDPPPARTIDNKQVLAEVEASIKAGKVDVAINQLREAIDTEPLDPERRQHLVRLLLEYGHTATAAGEARRAAALMPEGVELRVLAARAWMDVGQPAEAQADLNEALARNPEHAQVQLLQGELKLLSGDFVGAATVLSASIAKAPSGEAYFARSIAYSLGGDVDAAKKDMDEAEKLGQASSAAKLRLLWPIATGRAETACDEIRLLIQKIKLKPKDAPTIEAAEALLKPLDSLAAMLAALEPNPKNKNSHQRLLLALNLLSQSVSGILDFAKSGSEEVLSEASINLGEGVKNLTSVKELRKIEN